MGASDINGSGAFVPTIKGFNATDVIDFQGAVTNAQYASGVLSLYDGAGFVATLGIGSGYTNSFSALALSDGYTQIDYLGGEPSPRQLERQHRLLHLEWPCRRLLERGGELD